MCGIIGMAGDITRKHVDIFEDMLDVIQLRGRHSTGVIKVDRRNNYQWAKAVGTPNFLKDTHAYTDMIDRGMLPNVLIGHGRHKTVGDVDWKSAHPFEIEDKSIVGVHNGTLQAYHSWDAHKVGMTDSEALYRRIAEEQPENVFPDVRGAYACVWWDGEKGLLRMIRNDERPLYLTYSEDKRVAIWASETWMFGAFSRRMPLWKPEKGEKYLQPQVDHLYSFEVNGNATKDKPTTILVEDRKLEKKKVVSTYTPPASRTTNSHGSSKGGEVANPFLGKTPDFLKLPHPSSLNNPKSTNTSGLTSDSGTSSKSSSDQSKQSKPTPSSLTNLISPQSQRLPESLRTNRKKLSVVSGKKADIWISQESD